MVALHRELFDRIVLIYNPANPRIPLLWPTAYGMIFVAGCLTCLLLCSPRVTQATHAS